MNKIRLHYYSGAILSIVTNDSFVIDNKEKKFKIDNAHYDLKDIVKIIANDYIVYGK